MGMKQPVTTRVVDTAAYVGALRELVQEGHEVSMLVSGSSMSPFLIHLRDTIYFKAPSRPLRAGDMVFYQRDSGQYVMHRILRVRGDVYDIAGDAQTEVSAACGATRSSRSSRACGARASSLALATAGGCSLSGSGRSSSRCVR